MAIYHLTTSHVSRSTGRSAVAAAAYRAGESLINEMDGLRHDYTRRDGVAHAEIVVPEGVRAEWAQDREMLWNAAEAAERRKDARTAREVIIALPSELTADERRALTHEMASRLATQYGVAVDFAIHDPGKQGDQRNHHAHLLMTTRLVTEEGLGRKSDFEQANFAAKAAGKATQTEHISALREAWAELANQHLARAGHDVRIDHRSNAALGIELEPSRHQGVAAAQMERDGRLADRGRFHDEAKAENTAKLIEKPEHVLAMLTAQKSVFDRRDVARVLHRYIDTPETFQTVLARAMASKELVQLSGADGDQRYSTRTMIETEREMAAAAERMAGEGGFQVSGRTRDIAMRQQAERDGIILAPEQMQGVAQITGPERLVSVVGIAGAGKSTMLATAKAAWEREGYTVVGAALAGKAAEGLRESAGIESRTLASLELAWAKDRDRLGKRTILVIDEAGMVGSQQLGRVLAEADEAGAKVVLVGDPEQLQPIGAGAAFRAIAERTGYVELDAVRRQTEAWQRQATWDFGKQRTAAGLAAYEAHGAIQWQASAEEAKGQIIRDVVADMDARPDGTRLVMAHRRADAQALNEAIRAARKEQGGLAGERVYETTEGKRAFAEGDRVMFRQNDRSLGVQNGTLGTVREAAQGRLVVALDDPQGPGKGRVVTILPDAPTDHTGIQSAYGKVKTERGYNAIDHGYAATIHKSQGATVDRAYVLASGGMDRHLTYVSMTRHRDEVRLYAARDAFRDMGALNARLSRSGEKETTLDYAERRGIEPPVFEPPVFASPVRSEILVERQKPAGQEIRIERDAERKDLEQLAIQPDPFEEKAIARLDRQVAEAQAAREAAWSRYEPLRDENSRFRALAYKPDKNEFRGNTNFFGVDNAERKAAKMAHKEWDQWAGRVGYDKIAAAYQAANRGLDEAKEQREQGIPKAIAQEKARAALVENGGQTQRMRFDGWNAWKADPKGRPVFTPSHELEAAEKLEAGKLIEQYGARFEDIRDEAQKGAWKRFEKEETQTRGWGGAYLIVLGQDNAQAVREHTGRTIEVAATVDDLRRKVQAEREAHPDRPITILASSQSRQTAHQDQALEKIKGEGAAEIVRASGGNYWEDPVSWAENLAEEKGAAERHASIQRLEDRIARTDDLMQKEYSAEKARDQGRSRENERDYER